MTGYIVKLNGKTFDVRVLERSGSNISFQIEGEKYTIDVAPLLDVKNSSSNTKFVPSAPLRSASQGKVTSPNEIRAPMPGIIVHIPIKEGDTIRVGQTVLVMEAMKMENNIQAPKTGMVKKIHVSVGEEVENTRLLITIEDN